ncbi:MAG: hypothetical protein ACI4V3_01885 [Faecousia sp.]
MKKIISVLLVLVLVLTMSTTAFAATIDTTPGSQDIDVNAKYEDGVSAPTKYSVDVAWGAMEFTYTVSGTKTWDPATHTYTASTTPAWSGSGNTITVTNHSNTGITASFAFHALDAYNTVTGTFSAAGFQLPTAEDKAVNAAELTGTTTLTLSGTLENTVTSLTKVGAVSVTIS